MRRLAALLLGFFSTFSFAASTTDFTDLWYNPAENGWGANVIQQADTLFITLFVYGTYGAPTWYVASDVEYAGTTTSGAVVFSGTLYQTSGPWFGATYDASLFGVTPVGTITFSSDQVATATLSYTVNGIPVVKSVQRQTWKQDDLTGSYLGGSTGTWSNCGATRNGYQEAPAIYTVASAGVSVTIQETVGGSTCNYAGTYTQTGRLGQISGTGLCSDGINQAFTATEVESTLQGLTMRFATSQIGGCSFLGQIGGIRRSP